MKKSRIILETKGDNPGEPLRKCKNYKNNSASQIKQSNFYLSYVLYSLEYSLIFFSGYLLCRLAIRYHPFPRIFFSALILAFNVCTFSIIFSNNFCRRHFYNYDIYSESNIKTLPLFGINSVVFLFTKRVVQILFNRCGVKPFILCFLKNHLKNNNLYWK